jgi:hypothetical protein
MTGELMGNFSACGGLIMLATGLRISGIKNFPIANLLPALVFVIPLSAFWLAVFRRTRMDKTLAARLARIRSASKATPPAAVPSPTPAVRGSPAGGCPAVDTKYASWEGWETVAPLVRRRVLYAERYFDLGPQLNPALSILCPGAAAAFPGGTGPERGRLLLFDLETTGLSAAAGTVAFLAAFARFVPDGRIAQPDCG